MNRNDSDHLVWIEERGAAGLITLNRPKALNALNLPMIRLITAALLKWRAQPAIKCVAIRGTSKQADGSFAPFGNFCAGGDIRFFHQAVLAGDPALEDFFTEEYALNHLIHHYPKPYISFLDGIVIGGGMGIAGHGGANAYRIATERSKLSMPETAIGLFPDVGGGYFLSRCMGHSGEYMALTGRSISDMEAMQFGLIDQCFHSSALPEIWQDLSVITFKNETEVKRFLFHNFQERIKNRNEEIDQYFDQRMIRFNDASEKLQPKIDQHFCHDSIPAIFKSLASDASDWAQTTLAILRKRSPLMLCVTLELIRRARSMNLRDDLILERSMVRHCFHTAHLNRFGKDTETMEGIRALAIDKDHAPRWNPARIEDVSLAMVEGYFAQAWPTHANPMLHLR